MKSNSIPHATNFILVFCCAVIFGVATHVRAAIITVTPPDSENVVTIHINTEGASVNAIEAHLAFDPSLVSVVEVNNGESVIPIWITSPIVEDSGTIDLAGIIPGGIVIADGTIVRVKLAPKDAKAIGGTPTSLRFTGTTVLLNDGKGTPAKVATVSNPFLLAKGESASTSVDTRAPDSFVPVIARDANIFDGKYFVAFSATDGHSGIDHYEILEAPVSDHGTLSPNWTKASSPYLLADQSLSSDVYVRAVDGAGNFRVVRIVARTTSANTTRARWFSIAIIGGMLLLLVGGLWRAYLLWKSKHIPIVKR